MSVPFGERAAWPVVGFGGQTGNTCVCPVLERESFSLPTNGVAAVPLIFVVHLGPIRHNAASVRR